MKNKLCYSYSKSGGKLNLQYTLIKVLLSNI